MIRTQVYLTDRQRSDVTLLSKNKGKKQSELIRDAIDCFIEQASQQHSPDPPSECHLRRCIQPHRPATYAWFMKI